MGFQESGRAGTEPWRPVDCIPGGNSDKVSPAEEQRPGREEGRRGCRGHRLCRGVCVLFSEQMQGIHETSQLEAAGPGPCGGWVNGGRIGRTVPPLWRLLGSQRQERPVQPWGWKRVALRAVCEVEWTGLGAGSQKKGTRSHQVGSESSRSSLLPPSLPFGRGDRSQVSCSASGFGIKNELECVPFSSVFWAGL